VKPALILIAALALMAFAALGLSRPAHAGPVADWGGTGCRLDKALQQEHVAVVTYHNELTGGVEHNAGSVDLYGLQIRLIVTMGAGNMPDRFEVIAPEGFVAVPREVVLQEGKSGVVLIFAIAGMLIG
jgi:hypothetical protein